MKEPTLEQHYDSIDEENRHSWYLDDDPDYHRPFTVVQSVGDAGPARVDPNDTPVPLSIDFQKELNRAARTIDEVLPGGRFKLGGNMSTIVRADGTVPYGPTDMTNQERYDDGLANMMRHFEAINVDPAAVRVLNPERKYIGRHMSVVNVDEDKQVYEGGTPIRLEKEGDFMYTYNPNLVLAARPADCPIAYISAETPKGTVFILVHFAWRGAANDEAGDVRDQLDKLGIDYASMRVYITAGGHAKSFHFKDYVPDDEKENPTPVEGRLFKNVVDNNGVYSFDVDATNDVYETFRDFGLEPEQIFVDTTDTTSNESGTGSHSRSVNLEDDNMRDIVTVQFEQPPSKVASNPDRPTPPEIEWQIVPLKVDYIDFDGNRQTGEIEINRAVYDDVKAFFAKALEIGYPIDKLVKSSDPEYGWDDSKLLSDNASSGFNYRLIAGTDRVSKHGSGYAFDINTLVNPYYRFVEPSDKYPDGVIADPPGAVYDPDAKGALTADHPLVVFIKGLGWKWGGDWVKEFDADGKPTGRTDYQHFEKILPTDPDYKLAA